MTHADPSPPQVFVSYSWDDDEHTNWVLRLVTRLRENGIDVVLDLWDTRLGSDLSLFMERAADTTYRVLAVVSTPYVEKANAAVGGVGVERKMITPSLMRDLHGHRVVPILRNNTEGLLPHFLGAAKYVDFRKEADYEDRYYELLQELHGIPQTPKPPLGRNPFIAGDPTEVATDLRHDKARYVDPALTGEVTFDHSNNNGHFVIGAGDRAFTLDFSPAGRAVYIMNDPSDIHTVALAPHVTDAGEVGDASQYDGSSRHRTIRVGDAAILRNQGNYWAAVFVDAVVPRELSPTGNPFMTFRYVIPAVPGPDSWPTGQ